MVKVDPGDRRAFERNPALSPHRAATRKEIVMKALLALSIAAAAGASLILISAGSAGAATSHAPISSVPVASAPAAATTPTMISHSTSAVLSTLSSSKGITRVLYPAWNPWRSACATVVAGAAFALGYWTLSRLEWVGAWMAGHFVSGGVIRTMLAWFSWGWVYNVAYNDVC